MFGIGDVAKKIRKSRKLSLVHMQKVTGIDKNTISDFERGASNTKIETVDKICDALGISAGDLFRLAEAEGGSLDKSREIGKGSQPLPSPAKEAHGMESWREQFKDTVGGMVNSPEEAQRVKDEVMKWLVEWRAPQSPLPEENAQ